MTYSTKLAEMCVSCGLGGYDIERIMLFQCPTLWFDADEPYWCKNISIPAKERCLNCWKREIPEDKESVYDTVKIVRCRNCTYSVPGKDDSHVICMAEKAYRDSDFFCKNGEHKKN